MPAGAAVGLGAVQDCVARRAAILDWRCAVGEALAPVILSCIRRRGALCNSE